MLTILPKTCGAERRTADGRALKVRGVSVRWLVVLAIAVAPVLIAEAADDRPDRHKQWPSSRAPEPLPPHEVDFPPYEIRTLGERVARHRDLAPRAARRLRATAGAGRCRAGPCREVRAGHADGVAARSGHQDADGRADRRHDRLRRRCARRRVRHRPVVRQRAGDEGQLRPGHGPGRGHRAQPGLRRRGDRPAAAADAVGAAGEPAGPRLPGGRRHRPPDLRIPPLRRAVRRHAGVGRVADARRSRDVPRELVRARTTRSWPSSAT